jgi:hypothetical protein
MRIDQILVADFVVPEHLAPEGPYLVNGERVDRDLQVLDGGGVSGYVQVACRGGDLAGKVNVATAEASRFVGEEPYGYAAWPQVNIGGVIRGASQVTDPLYQGDAGTKRSDPKVGACPPATPQHAPVADAGGLVELLRGQLIGHALTLLGLSAVCLASHGTCRR